jgi:hypothetical protein
MKILSMGCSFNHPSAEEFGFGSSTSLFDYDILIWDPNELVYDYYSYYKDNGQKYMGYPLLDESDSAAIQRDLIRRKKEIIDFLSLGRTVVVFAPKCEKFCVYTGEKTHSGTGRSQKTTKIVGDLNIEDFLPMEKMKLFDAEGSQIEFIGGEPFNLIWKQFSEYLTYRSYFENISGEPIFYIKNTDKIIGTYISYRKGNLLIIPKFLDDEYDFKLTDAKEEKLTKKFIDALEELVCKLNQEKGDFKLPLWCSHYFLPTEIKDKNELDKLNEELNKIESQISKKRNQLAELEQIKILFGGDGKALEIEVGKILEELGFDVAEGLPQRDDLILKYKDNVAVVEIKGVSKSAAEKHAAQLEKWVSEYITRKGIKPKGILIVNAFKDTPLIDRNGLPFPEQMISYSKNREHYLITGLQLLCMYLDTKDDPKKKEEMIELLLGSNGFFSEYSDWHAFLEVRLPDKS